MRPVEDLSVVVTGGGSGIGEAIARRFARGGARVTICGRREEKLRAVAEDLGSACAWLTADVTSTTDRVAIVDTAMRHGGAIDVLVSNAGNMWRRSVEEWTDEGLAGILANNVIGGMMLTQAALPHLVAARGAVIFVGSIYTKRAYPGAAPYAISKGAVETLTRVLAAELGPRGVRVNAVRPGAVPTEINVRSGDFTPDEATARLKSMAAHHALGRIGTTEEVAECVEYLARADWTTGAVVSVDGGLSLGIITDEAKEI